MYGVVHNQAYNTSSPVFPDGARMGGKGTYRRCVAGWEKEDITCGNLMGDFREAPGGAKIRGTGVQTRKGHCRWPTILGQELNSLREKSGWEMDLALRGEVNHVTTSKNRRRGSRKSFLD